MSEFLKKLESILERFDRPQVTPIEIPATSDSRERFALVPAGSTLHQFTDHELGRVKRPEEKIKVYRVESFLAYWTRFSNDKSVCFGDLGNLQLKGVVDYHAADGSPEHCAHDFTFKPATSNAWDFWRKVNGREISQKDFQRLLEARADDIVTPNGAELLDIVANLEATMKIAAGDTERLDNGGRKIHYVKENQIVGGVTIPATMEIVLPIFEAGEPISVKVMLRWNISEDDHKVKFSIEIPDAGGVEQDAFQDLAVKAENIIDDRFFWAAK